jgi:hypothetical protein
MYQAAAIESNDLENGNRSKRFFPALPILGMLP